LLGTSNLKIIRPKVTSTYFVSFVCFCGSYCPLLTMLDKMLDSASG
jgi:hypothetical protein